MSRRVVAVVVVVVLVLTTAGLVITYLQKARLNANLVTSQNNLRQLAQFAAHHANPDPNRKGMPKEIPAATVLLPGVPPENRLSWFVHVLPSLDQRRQDVIALLTQIDQMQPWNSERNQTAARTRLVVSLSPMNTPQVSRDQPAITCYVAIAGLGPDAATILLPPTGPAPPRAGAWRYDAVTPFDRISDGLSQTLLIGETSNDVGPWLRGGPSTTRGFDDAPNAKPLIGAVRSSAAISQTARTSRCATARSACSHRGHRPRCCSEWRRLVVARKK